MTSWHSTAVSCRAMRTRRRRHGAPQSALRHWRSTKFPSVQHDKLWPTSIFVRRPSCLELTARIFATNHFNRTLQALSKNVFIRVDIALSALEAFLLNGLYKFTYLLILLTLHGATRSESKTMRMFRPVRQVAAPRGQILLSLIAACLFCCGYCSVSHPENVLANATWMPYFENEANIGPEVIHLYEVQSRICYRVACELMRSLPTLSRPISFSA